MEDAGRALVIQIISAKYYRHGRAAIIQPQ